MSVAGLVVGKSSLLRNGLLFDLNWCIDDAHDLSVHLSVSVQLRVFVELQVLFEFRVTVPLMNVEGAGKMMGELWFLPLHCSRKLFKAAEVVFDFVQRSALGFCKIS